MKQAKLSTVIAQLTELMDFYGDLPVSSGLDGNPLAIIEQTNADGDVVEVVIADEDLAEALEDVS